MIFAVFRKIFFGIIFNALALYVLLMFVKEIQYTGGYTFFVIGGIFLGLLNAVVKPVLRIVSLPFVVLSGGLFLIVINIGILWLLGYTLDVAQFRECALIFPNLGSYVIGGLVLGVINFTTNLIIKL